MKFMKLALLIIGIFFISHLHLGTKLEGMLVILFWQTMAWLFCAFMCYGLFRHIRGFYRGFLEGLNGNRPSKQ